MSLENQNSFFGDLGLMFMGFIFIQILNALFGWGEKKDYRKWGRKKERKM
jgi:hypothetical protein